MSSSKNVSTSNKNVASQASTVQLTASQIEHAQTLAKEQKLKELKESLKTASSSKSSIDYKTSIEKGKQVMNALKAQLLESKKVDEEKRAQKKIDIEIKKAERELQKASKVEKLTKSQMYVCVYLSCLDNNVFDMPTIYKHIETYVNDYFKTHKINDVCVASHIRNTISDHLKNDYKIDNISKKASAQKYIDEVSAKLFKSGNVVTTIVTRNSKK